MKRYRQDKYRKVKKKSLKVFLWPFLLVVLVIVLYFFFFSSFLKIRDVEINSVLKLSEEKIRDIVYKEADKKTAIVISRNILFIDLKSVRSEILSQFPQIREVNLKKKLFASLVVNIEPRVPVGVWCRFEECFKLDEEGIIYEKSQEQGKLIIRTEKETLLGQKVIDYLDVILEIKRNLNIKEFFVAKETNKLVAKTSEGWDIYFNPKKNISEQLSKLNLVLKERITSSENLQYIDLRFSNRIFYKKN